jgi:hypothetical protein
MTGAHESDTAIPPLHDALLLRVEIIWEEAIARLTFQLVSSFVTLSIQSFTLVECPRRLPWGRSRSVNEVNLTPDPSGAGYRLTLEMQTGDNIVICGETIEVRQQKDAN